MHELRDDVADKVAIQSTDRRHLPTIKVFRNHEVPSRASYSVTDTEKFFQVWHNKLCTMSNRPWRDTGYCLMKFGKMKMHATVYDEYRIKMARGQSRGF